MHLVVAGLPYESIPKIMVRGLGKKVQDVLNKFPAHKGRVSTTISPEEIVERKRKMDFNKKRISYGQ